MKLKVDDFVLTPKKRWEDLCWPGRDIPEHFIGCLGKVVEIINGDSHDLVKINNGRESRYFDIKNLTKVDVPTYTIGQRVRLTNKYIYWDKYNWPRPWEDILKDFDKTPIGVVTGISNPFSVIVRLEPNVTAWSFNPMCIEPIVKSPIAKRVSTHVKNRESFYSLLVELEGELDFEYSYSRTPLVKEKSTKGLIHITADGKAQIKMPLSEDILVLPYKKDMLKSYKEYKAEINRRWKGNLVTKEQFISVYNKWKNAWVTQYGDALEDEIVNTKHALEKEIGSRAILIPRIEKGKEFDKFLNTLAPDSVPKDILEFITQGISTGRYSEGKVKEIIKKIEKYTNDFKRLEEQKKKRLEGSQDVARQELETINDLLGSKIIEEFGIDGPNFYVIYSPIVLSYNRLKSCPEHGPTCTCLTAPRRYFYLGRVKVHFHNPNDCKFGKRCHGFLYETLTYKDTQYKLFHPHMRIPVQCNDGCYHGYEAPKVKLLQRGEISSLIMFIRQFISNYNPHHGLLGIDNFAPFEIRNKKKPDAVKDGTFDIEFIEKMYGELTEENKNYVKPKEPLCVEIEDVEVEDELEEVA